MTQLGIIALQPQRALTTEAPSWSLRVIRCCHSASTVPSAGLQQTRVKVPAHVSVLQDLRPVKAGHVPQPQDTIQVIESE